MAALACGRWPAWLLAAAVRLIESMALTFVGATGATMCRTPSVQKKTCKSRFSRSQIFLILTEYIYDKVLMFIIRNKYH
jgi:hypothetical protein